MSKRHSMVVAGMATAMLMLQSTQAQDITRFDRGYLTFTNENPALYYRIEFRPNLTGAEAWDGTFRGLWNIQSSDQEVTVPVGVFYRVVGSETPEPFAPVPKTGQTESYQKGDNGDLDKGVTWPTPRFTNHSDGTVTDNLTGLMWVKSAHSLDGNSGAMNWNNAINFCNNLTFAGHSDWRLPNLHELQSLIDYGRYNPALPDGHPFTGVLSDYYWSSSTAASNTGFAWYVYLHYGHVYGYYKTNMHRVWPVRAGQ